MNTGGCSKEPGKWFLTREYLSDREEKYLAPYAMKGSQSKGRRYQIEEHGDRAAFRGIYQRDRDRIIHSSAFRRLEYKTQVFVNHEGDHFRTRLTHTLEVAQISRSIARVLMLNEDLTESIALAHDLGHTPFGHSGEEVLAELMRDHGGFEHNLHGLRVVDKLERRYPDFEGLNLTYEVRESIFKHSTVYDGPSQKAEIPENLRREFDPSLQPVLEAQIVDAADEIAYNNHDLADGLEMGIIDRSKLRDVKLWAESRADVEAKMPQAPCRIKDMQTIAWLIHRDVLDLVDNSYHDIRENGIKDVDDVRHHPSSLVGHSGTFSPLRKELQQFLLDNVYRHYKVERMTRKSRMFVAELFNAYTASAASSRQLPPKYADHIEEDGVERVVCDYIASMTDRYAQDEYKRLFYPFEPV